MNRKFPDIHCHYCDKWLGECCLEIFTTGYRNYLINGKRRHFCNKDCYEKYKAQFEIIYKDEKLYKVGNEMYTPYIGCHYYFKTEEDCYQRIQQKHLCYFP